MLFRSIALLTFPALSTTYTVLVVVSGIVNVNTSVAFTPRNVPFVTACAVLLGSSTTFHNPEPSSVAFIIAVVPFLYPLLFGTVGAV